LKKDFAAVSTEGGIAFVEARSSLQGVTEMAGDLVVGVESWPCEAVVVAFALPLGVRFLRGREGE